MRNQQPFSQEQYEMLKRCSDKNDLTEWNEWRKSHPDTIIWLQGGDFKGWWLQHANFMHGRRSYASTHTSIIFEEVHLEGSVFEWANLQKANFSGANMNDTKFWSAHAEGACFGYSSLMRAKLGTANFENCDFRNAILENASFTPSQLNGAKFTKSDLRGCSMRMCVVDGSTKFFSCIINRYSKSERFTDFTGTALNNVIITSGEKQLLEYNIRRKNWEDWYWGSNTHRLFDEKDGDKKNWLKTCKKTVRLIMTSPVRIFWWISDYGISTKRVIFAFFGLAGFFAVIYSNWACWFPPGIVSNFEVEPHLPLWHYGFLVFLRPIYFSVVTMTTLGFGDMYANSQSIWGHILLTIQVILGYVLLGALVTRFAVLFTAGGPAGKFADDKRRKTDGKGQKTEE